MNDMIGALSKVVGVSFGQRGVGGRALWRGILRVAITDRRGTNVNLIRDWVGIESI